MMTFNTFDIIPKTTMRAFTLLSSRIELLTLRTTLAILSRLVIKFSTLAGDAFFAIEERFSRRTVFTLLGGRIVDLLVGAKDTFFFGLVEILGNIACYTFGAIPVGSLRTLATILNQHFPTLTSLTQLLTRIP